MKERIGWGLIGCGDIARKRVAAALGSAPGSDLIAVSRARAELAAEFAREFGARRHYSDWRDLINDPEVDAVYIATPVHLHAEQTIAAAEAGKHVLCEKPMALNVEECDRMIEACASHGVRLGIAYYRRFYPAVARLREIISSGEIGRPVLIEAKAFERFNRAPGEDRYWLLEAEKSGGGPMMDFGCHRIEIFLDLLGPLSEPAGVKAVTTQALFSRAVEDTAVAVFSFASGAAGVLTVTHAAREALDTLDLYGSEGSVHIPVLNQGVLQIRTAGGERTEACPPHSNLHQPLVEDFIAAVKEGRAPRVDGEAGRAVSIALAQIYGA